MSSSALLKPAESTFAKSSAAQMSNDGAERLRALLVMLNHPDPPSTAELERLFQGRAGQAFTFIVDHVVGRQKACFIRAELQGLKDMPRMKTKGVFTGDTCVGRLTRTQSKLAQIKAEVAQKRKDLEELLQYSAAPSPKPMTELRATACLLQALLAKEKIRIERIKNIKKTLVAIRDKGKRRETTPTQAQLSEMLFQLAAQMPYESDEGKKQDSKSALRQIPSLILSSTSLQLLCHLSEDASQSLRNLFKEIPQQPQYDDFLDTLAHVHMWHNKLSRELPKNVETDGKGIPKRALDQTQIVRPFGKTSRSIEADRQTFFISSPSHKIVPITKIELENLGLKLKYEAQRAEKLLSLFLSVVDAASRVSIRVNNRGEAGGPLQVAEALNREKEKRLRGYVDLLRQRIVSNQNGNHQSDGTLREKELISAIGLAFGSSSQSVLTRVERLVVQNARLRKILLTMKALTEVPMVEIEERTIEDHLTRQSAHDEKAITLLTRKNRKMAMVHVLEKDIQRFLDEAEAVVSRKITGK